MMRRVFVEFTSHANPMYCWYGYTSARTNKSREVRSIPFLLVPLSLLCSLPSCSTRFLLGTNDVIRFSTIYRNSKCNSNLFHGKNRQRISVRVPFRYIGVAGKPARVRVYIYIYALSFTYDDILYTLFSSRISTLSDLER